MDKETELKIVTEGKFCISCEHVATSHSGDPASFRCFAPENVESSTLNLVNGKYEKRYKYSNCQLARTAPGEEGCGEIARWFKKRLEPTFKLEPNDPSKPTKRSSNKISADDL